MRRIILEDSSDETIRLSEVSQNTPIFARLDGEMVGMVVKDTGKGWFLALGGENGATGYHETLKELLLSCGHRDYIFIII